jgi:hypothetical protein
MLQWDKSISSLNVPASGVINLFRSMREVQMALPGHPAQQTSSYLCQYRVEGGAATVVVFHMHKSEVLAFFPTDPQVVPEGKVDSMLDKGLGFVESMGFLMTDQDIHLLDESDQEMLWSSLPLKSGIVVEEEDETPAPAKQPEPETAAEPAAKSKKSTDELAQALKAEAKKETPKPTPVPAAPAAQAEPENNENVDDLLAAVEAMRAKRPGLRARKLAPSPEEMDRRKQELRENVGRILASL